MRDMHQKIVQTREFIAKQWRISDCAWDISVNVTGTTEDIASAKVTMDLRNMLFDGHRPGYIQCPASNNDLNWLKALGYVWRHGTEGTASGWEYRGNKA